MSKSLKEQALLERIGQLTVMYEDKIADLRVEITETSRRVEQLEANRVQVSDVPEGVPVAVDVTGMPPSDELDGTTYVVE